MGEEAVTKPVVGSAGFLMAGESRTIAEMWGDFLREAAVLVAVFAPLEAIVTHGIEGLTVGRVGVIVALAGGLLIAGMTVDKGTPMTLLPVAILGAIATVAGLLFALKEHRSRHPKAENHNTAPARRRAAAV